MKTRSCGMDTGLDGNIETFRKPASHALFQSPTGHVVGRVAPVGDLCLRGRRRQGRVFDPDHAAVECGAARTPAGRSPARSACSSRTTKPCRNRRSARLPAGRSRPVRFPAPVVKLRRVRDVRQFLRFKIEHERVGVICHPKLITGHRDGTVIRWYKVLRFDDSGRRLEVILVQHVTNVRQLWQAILIVQVRH